MKMKKTVLKELIKQVVRESIAERERNALLTEAKAKKERMIQHIKKSLRKSHPKWSEEKVTSVAIATTKKKQKGAVKEAGAISEDINGFPQPESPAPEMGAPEMETPGMEEPEVAGAEGYDEKEEMLLIKVMQLIANKLAAMHGENDLVQKDQDDVGGEEPEANGGEFGGDEVGEPNAEEPTEPSPEGGEGEEAGEAEPEGEEGGEFPPAPEEKGEEDDEEEKFGGK